MIFKKPKYKPAITLILCLASSQIKSSKIEDYFGGEALSEKALRYDDQEAVIQTAPTKANDLPSISTLLSSSAAEVEARLQSRALDAIGLANAAKTSTTHSTSNYGDGPDSCCNKQTEIGYNHYFKSEVDMQNMCYRGTCNLSGRALTGTPSCENAVVSGDFFTEVKNNMNDPGAAWQYFGAEAGVSTMFPASFPGYDSCPKDPYDPRLRPWYVQALTTDPLDVVIILDKSGSMVINERMKSAKKAVKSILSMLRPYDRFAVTPFDSSSIPQVWTGASCMDSHNLAFATGKNVGMMKSYIDRIETSGGTMYSYALNFAKTIFTSSTLNVTDEYDQDRKKVLMFLSDGDPNDGPTLIMESLKSLLQAVPDLITMVYGLDIDNQILRDVANHDFSSYGIADPVPMPEPGEFEKITPQNIRVVLGRFYANSKVNPNGYSSIKVQYSMPYVDSFGMGLMVTASKPVLDDNDILQGVVGYDITLKYLLEPLEYLITETTYAWMFTKQRGYLVYHPKFVNPSAGVSDINPVHYSILEPDQGQIDAITAQLRNQNFTLSYSGERYVETPREGGYTSTSKVGTNKVREQFFTDCQTVNPAETDFDLVICVTKVGDLQSTLDTQQTITDVTLQPSTYHVPQDSQVAGICSHGFRKAFKFTGGVKFAPRQFLIPTKYMAENETALELEKMDELLNDVASSHANLNPELIETTRATNMIMSGLDIKWRDQDMKIETDLGSSSSMVIDIENADSELVPVWRYFGSIEGTFRVWPNTQLAQAYDPAQRGWFVQALRGDEGTTFISTPYIDAFGMGYLITVSRTINYNNNGEIAGVIGTDYFVSQFGESALQFDDNERSIIIDSIGQLIYHSDFHPNNYGGFFPYVNVKFREKDKSISGSEPLTLSEITFEHERVSDMLLRSGVPTLQCHDVTNLRTKKTFDIDKYLKSRNKDVVTVSEFTIKRLKGTNAFIMSPKKSGYMFKVLHDPEKHNYFGGKKEPDYYKGWPVVVRPSWTQVHNKYDQCENVFSGGESIPACQSPGPSLDDSYLGKFDKEKGFRNQKIEGLENCFDYMNNWKDYFLYKEDTGNHAVKMSGSVKFFIFLVLVIVLINIYGRLTDEEDEEGDGGNMASEFGVAGSGGINTNFSNAMPRAYQHHSNAPDMGNQSSFSPRSQTQGQPLFHAPRFGDMPQAPLHFGAPRAPQPPSPREPSPAPQPVFNINISSNNTNENKN